MGSAKNLAIVVGATMAWTGFLKTIGINVQLTPWLVLETVFTMALRHSAKRY